MKEAILLEIQFRAGLNPFVKWSQKIFNFVSQYGKFKLRLFIERSASPPAFLDKTLSKSVYRPLVST
ncbi:hypothetical protein COO91_07015 [Nostoc flagelliforme CCNUN1]|uniref:Uncharacterized protein n=1 Tax=Nostoc flagelliforme CCNUN1 TaxID=2038116 RepID=A0A2K8SZY2_9NOSO|nr:hypothetical protein COO91_07015 [Nostoc flagelliforme CCNUN1]